jgi:hypothetical protein
VPTVAGTRAAAPSPERARRFTFGLAKQGCDRS